jgi:hypothetical protein
MANKIERASRIINCNPSARCPPYGHQKKKYLFFSEEMRWGKVTPSPPPLGEARKKEKLMDTTAIGRNIACSRQKIGDFQPYLG